MLTTVPLYWVPVLNPLVTLATVKPYRRRTFAVVALFGRSGQMAAVAPSTTAETIMVTSASAAAGSGSSGGAFIRGSGPLQTLALAPVG